MDLSWNDLGENVDNLKWLGKVINQLPTRNLKDFKLNLTNNGLGENYGNLKYLGEGLRDFP